MFLISKIKQSEAQFFSSSKELYEKLTNRDFIDIESDDSEQEELNLMSEMLTPELFKYDTIPNCKWN
jgi:hypothetical protein